MRTYNAQPEEGLVKTGVTFVDSLLDGGMRPGKVFAHCGTIGSGKTTLATQIAANILRQEFRRGSRRNIYYFDVEGNADYKAKLFSYLAQIDRAIIFDALFRTGLSGLSTRSNYKQYEKERNPKEIEEAESGGRAWPPGEQERLESTESLLTCFKYCTDQQLKGINGLSAEYLSGMIDKSNAALIVVDGLGSLTELVCHVQRRSSAPEDFRRTARTLRQLAAECQCPVWVTHQLNSNANKSETTGQVPDTASTSRIKSLWSYVDDGIVSGLPQNARAIFRRLLPPSLSDQFIIGQLDTRYARWVEPDRKWQIWNGRISEIEGTVERQSYLTPGWDPRADGFAN